SHFSLLQIALIIATLIAGDIIRGKLG
ncbi:uncharacterized protein METZ01_LOCUS443163, partial [marine metagenome]